MRSGMSIARLNLCHYSHEDAARVIRDLRAYLATTKDSPQVAIWIDANGPKVRTGKLENGGPVYLKRGNDFIFSNDPAAVGNDTMVSTSYTRELLSVGDKICVDDGRLSFTVLERVPNGIRTKVENDGYLGEDKGVNFPEKTITDLPAISEKDRKDLQFAITNDVDFVSISCIRNVHDIEELRFVLGNSYVKLLAKIENKRGLDSFDSILKVADGIVIDRGYLGAEVDVELVTIAQKKLIAAANITGKSVFVANQILESMNKNPRPTRSEAADVANAVMDGVDGLVLSAETAVGDFVFETITTMRRIAYQAEVNTNYLEYQMKAMRNVTKPIHVNESIASSAVLCARQVGAAIVICITEGGGTARLVAKYRPLIPVMAATTVARTARQLSANFGLVPYYHSGSAVS